MAARASATSALARATLLAAALLCARVGAQTYVPSPYPDSNCCSKCRSYGCVVNGGVVDAHTPCDPSGGGTWMFCEKTGCDGDCGVCACQKMSFVQRQAVKADIRKQALFYAYQNGERTILKLRCSDCGSADKGKVVPVLPSPASNAGDDGECDGDGTQCAGPSSKVDE